MPTERNTTEGWTWIRNSPKWHYFKEGRSVCGKFLLLKIPAEGFEIGNDESPENCVACTRQRLKTRSPDR